MADPLRVSFVSLGCPKNLVDSEKMLGQLAEAGCTITANEDDAEIIVINTCGFLEAARTEADEIIREVVARKADGGLRRVVVAGCLAQRDGAGLADRIHGIDALVGVNNRDDVVRAVLGAKAPQSRDTTGLFLGAYHPISQIDTARLRITPRHYAFLCISEGCDRNCTFCTIPAIRGPMHGKPPNLVLEEARELVSDGAVEISLVGQDTTAYGRGNDRFELGLAELLRELNTIDGVGWIRLMYAYPVGFDDEMIAAVAECDRVCKYIDLPLQHINSRVLKVMGRRVDRQGTEDLLQRIRERIPGVTLRTTLIAGFPGETDDEFEELLRFVKAFRFDALGVFPYSREPDTPAGKLPDQLPEPVKQQRVDELMRTQQKVAFELAKERIGKELTVLIDEVGRSRTVIGRHQGQAPSVDGVTYVERCTAKPGDFIAVNCTGRDGYDLVARPVRVPQATRRP